MFRRSNDRSFFTQDRRRSRVPPWLLLLLSGLVAGAAGVLVAQERYLPPRLSTEASAALRTAFEQAEAERVRLERELGQATRKLEIALDEQKGRGSELAAGKATIERLQADLASVVQSLPPDPRKGVVEVRAARFASNGGMLAYDVVLTRAKATAKPMAGVMQLVVSGESAKRSEGSVTLKPVALSMGRHEVVRGSLPLPPGFVPRQTTVQILDRSAGTVLGTRVWVVQ